LGKLTDKPGQALKERFPRHWPFTASPCRPAVNRKG
jgi:hypothetical protein